MNNTQQKKAVAPAHLHWSRHGDPLIVGIESGTGEAGVVLIVLVAIAAAPGVLVVMAIVMAIASLRLRKKMVRR